MKAMGMYTSRRSSIYLSLLFGAAALLVVAGVVYSPGEAFRASLSGLQIWWQNVFPGLLPPLILAELLAASGLLHGLAALAAPLTEKLFRLPGASGWAIAFGWSAGIPAGAKETARLLEKEMIQEGDVDAVLLVSHLPNPFLIVLVIGFGFLQAPQLGWAIAVGLWLSVLTSGYIWARLTRARIPRASKRPHASVRQALKVALEAKKEDGRPFGKQLADSVTHSVGTLMMIGGLMMMSAVILRLLQLVLPGNDLWLAVPGLYELHIGAYETSRSALFSSAPAQAAALLAAALAWSGWSGLLQARAAFGASPFPWSKVITSRLLHSALALLITYPLALTATSPYFKSLTAQWHWLSSPAAEEAWVLTGTLPNGWAHLSDSLFIALVSFGVFLFLALLALLIRPRTPGSHPTKKPPPGPF